MRKHDFPGESGQALTEYILALGLLALVVAAGFALWRLPLALYLNRIAQALAKIR